MKRSMTVGISSVFFLALSSFPAKAELVEIGRGYQDGLEGVTYVDTKTIYRKGTAVWWEGETVVRTSGGVLWHHFRALRSADCRRPTESRLRRLRFYSEEGRPSDFFTEPWDKGPIHRSPPDSVGAKTVKFVCSYR
jgi:hypothetical protein